MVQDESNEDINSNDDELEEMARAQAEDEEEYSMSQSGRRSKKKKSKNTISNKRMFVIQFTIGMLIIEIYFFANFFTQSSFLETCNVLGKELFSRRRRKLIAAQLSNKRKLSTLAVSKLLSLE